MMTDRTKATATPRMVTVCAPARPICLPNSPARMAPARGASGTSRYSVCISIISASPLLALEAVEIVDVDGRQVTEENHQDGQADRSFCGGDGQNEDHEHLAVKVIHVAGERNEIHVDGEQHQLDGHQQNDQVLAVQEDSDDGDAEQHRAENQIMRQRDHALLPSWPSAGAAGASTSAAIFTTRTRSAALTRTCRPGLIALLSLRLRNVSTTAPIRATSRMTEASSRGYT